MADEYWNQQRQYQLPISSNPHVLPPKRPRSDFPVFTLGINSQCSSYVSGHCCDDSYTE
ncbi:hypothetical protein AtNW77_Chr1g0023881 [Arabidopsis thaliana]